MHKELNTGDYVPPSPYIVSCYAVQVCNEIKKAKRYWTTYDGTTSVGDNDYIIYVPEEIEDYRFDD